MDGNHLITPYSTRFAQGRGGGDDHGGERGGKGGVCGGGDDNGGDEGGKVFMVVYITG